MGIGYSLVNNTKKEQVSFLNLPVSTKAEIIGSSVATMLVTHYLFENSGDDIQFVSDTYNDWPFSSGSKAKLHDYFNVTEKLLESFLSKGLFVDKGFLYKDTDEPDRIYIRNILLSSRDAE